MADKPGKLASKSNDGNLVRLPKLGAIKNDEISKAVIDKLTHPLIRKPYDWLGNEKGIMPSQELIWNVTDKTANNITDNRNMMQLLPDMELAKQILISSILSPNDLLSCELTINSDCPLLGDLAAPMLEVIDNYFKNVYKIESILPIILEDVLFNTGSYPMAVIPESSIDDAINSPDRIGTASMESIKTMFTQDGNIKPIGILGAPGAVTNRSNIGLETYTTYNPNTNVSADVAGGKFYLKVTDNPNILKNPLLKDKITRDRIQSLVDFKAVSLESGQAKTSDAEIRKSLYKTRNYKSVPVISLKTQQSLDKPTVGHPLVMTLPSESVIPVHTPGNPDEHIGYFVLLDTNGNPIAKAIYSDYYTDLAANINSNKDLVSQMLSITRRGVEGRKLNNTELNDVDEGVQLYMDVVEKELLERLRNGVYGDNVKIARPTEVYRIMFARACSRMYTQLLYIPKQLMTYVAFDYNKYGVGKSLLEDSKIIGAIRAMILFANTMAAIKNSVGHTELNIELDPNDPDPGHTIEMLMHEYVKTRQAAYPIGASNPLDIVNYLQAAGVEVTAQGHPGWPTTKLSVNDKTTNRPKVDTDLEDSLRKRHLMSVGISPEMVDLSMGADFATSVIQQNLLLAKRAMLMGKDLTFFIAEFMKMYSVNSETLMNMLRDIVKEKQDLVKKLDPNNAYGVDGLVNYFIANLEASLPEPNMKGLEMQLTAFEEYNKALDSVIPAFISTEMFDSNIFGELGNSIQTTVAIVKAHFQRRWLRENNVLPEMFDLINYTEDKGAALDLLNVQSEHMKTLEKSLLKFMKKVLPRKQKNDDELNNLGGVEEASAPADTGSEGEGAGEPTGDEDFGFDFGAEPEMPGEGEAGAGEAETPPEEGGEKAGEETPVEGGKEAAGGEQTPPETK